MRTAIYPRRYFSARDFGERAKTVALCYQAVIALAAPVNSATLRRLRNVSVEVKRWESLPATLCLIC